MSEQHLPNSTERAVEIAFGYIGLPYVFAGGNLDGPTNGGFDRAGFARHVVHAVSGIDIGRTLDEQLASCEQLPAGAAARAGDLIFWIDPTGRYQKAYHQAFYTGMQTVISLIPQDLAEPGAHFDTRLSAVGVQGTVFHELVIDDPDLLIAQPPAQAAPRVVLARPPYVH